MQGVFFNILTDASKCNVILQSDGQNDFHKSGFKQDNLLSSCRDKRWVSYFIPGLDTYLRLHQYYTVRTQTQN